MQSRITSVGEGSAASDEAVFHRVLVGIDSTDESLVAAAQAGVLRAPGGQLILLAAVERHLASHAGMLAPTAEDHLLAETSTELERAQQLLDADDAVLASGSLVRLLCSECASRGATLIAVGVRPHRRLGAVTFGGHDVEALHDARCSVLIARPGWGPAHPDRVLVGVDGSPEARAAERVARSLAVRLGCEVVPVVALGADLDVTVLRAERDDALLYPGSPLDAVVSASTSRSLIVVGRSRGRGRRWGGGLAERVVYAARCSVLVLEREAGREDSRSESGATGDG
ncbi:MAG TPA: universal stress protein [Gaiellaceae bacterium]|nr:universal stress protein [Gaiellaceae bacterium]